MKLSDGRGLGDGVEWTCSSTRFLQEGFLCIYRRHRAHPERAQELSSFRQKTPKAELYPRRGRLEEGRQMILSVFQLFFILLWLIASIY